MLDCQGRPQALSNDYVFSPYKLQTVAIPNVHLDNAKTKEKIRGWEPYEQKETTYKL